MWGNRRAISASGGVYTLQLPGASCTNGPPCIIGGPPYLIVEGNVDAAPPPASGNGSAPAPVAPTLRQAQDEAPTPWPAYDVSLRPIEIKGARDVWHKRDLPGYEMTLIAGPPFYRYQLTVVNGALTGVQRSLDPLAAGQADDAPVAMTTLYNRRDLQPLTVEGLFDRVTGYHEERPTCDTQVTVQLNGDWAFPRRIVEQWSDDCQAEEQAPRIEVVAFATLTPTPSPTPPPTPIPTNTATAIASPTRPTSHPAATATTAPPTPSAAPLPAQTTSGVNPTTWIMLLAGAVIVGAFLIWKNGIKRKT
ncbi:MAG: hypothetical protein GY831_03350, partial [Delftia sp.]|nr:hypothetical protein [Delftia sp.]